MKSGVIFECNNQRQQDSLQFLEKAGIFDILHEYNPTWIGTIPLEIDIPDSDLDIICEVYNFADFKRIVWENYSSYENFREKESETCYVAGFFFHSFEIEIYAESSKIQEQWGYKHMMIEHRLLELFGEDFKKEIIALKLKGHKTEPAFGKLLNLENPYVELIELKGMSTSKLHKRFRNI